MNVIIPLRKTIKGPPNVARTPISVSTQAERSTTVLNIRTRGAGNSPGAKNVSHA